MAIILCVDDEPDVLALRKSVLEKHGHTVVVARSGEAGLRLFRASQVELVLLDYWMTGTNGMEIGREMKRMKPDVPIIMLSGLGELPDESLGVADRWVMKSTRPEELLSMIAVLTQREKAAG